MTEPGRTHSPCPSCVGMAEAAVERAGIPLTPVQDGGFWDGFRYAQKALRDMRIATESEQEKRDA